MEKIIITNEQAGKRIDKFLVGTFFAHSRGELIRRIKDGEVTVNDKKIKPSYELREGDVVELHFSEQQNILQPNAKIAIKVIYEDKNIIVINKPAGLQVHPSNKKEIDTLVNGLIARYPEIISVHDGSVGAELRPGIVHRLDKDTSGVLVVARSQKAFDELKKSFKKRQVQKHYVAIVHGAIEEKKGVIEKPLARASSYRKQIIAKKNTKTIVRDAVTEFVLEKVFGNYSLVNVHPKTGRMHQIRVHLASIGHPIVGDVQYVPKNMRSETRLLAKRQLLHAQSIKFDLFDEKYSFSAAIPDEFEAFLKGLTPSLASDRVDENQQS